MCDREVPVVAWLLLYVDFIEEFYQFFVSILGCKKDRKKKKKKKELNWIMTRFWRTLEVERKCELSFRPDFYIDYTVEQKLNQLEFHESLLKILKQKNKLMIGGCVFYHFSLSATVVLIPPLDKRRDSRNSGHVSVVQTNIG